MFGCRSVAVILSSTITGVWLLGAATTAPSTRPAATVTATGPTTSAAPTTSPADLEAKARDEIKSATTRFARALDKGDLATARSLSIGNDREMALVEGMSAAMVAFKKVQDAAVGHFKEAGRALMQGEGTPADEMVRAVEEAEIQVDGNEAMVRESNIRAQALRLRKVDGQWKLDIHAMTSPEAVESGIAMFQKMTQAANDTTNEIRQGKFKSVEEARNALGERIRDAVAGTVGKPATQPSASETATTKPTTEPAATRP